jgi:hypothetical protein
MQLYLTIFTDRFREAGEAAVDFGKRVKLAARDAGAVGGDRVDLEVSAGARRRDFTSDRDRGL